MKKIPTGYVARCQCGVFVGAFDINRTDNTDASRLVSIWLRNGCTLEPRFTSTWKATIEPCQCN
ncbi:hypothetical protein ABD07_06655 [Nitrosomonas oligotropha]|nr:hypothetical protein [Nitrosomonas oligotropha]